MLKHLYKTFFTLSVAIFLTNCAADITESTSSLGNTSTTSVTGNQATESTEIISNEAGTFVGNGKPVTSLKFAMNASADSSYSEITKPYSDELSHCQIKSGNNDNSSLRCQLSGSHYQIKISSIALINCTDDSGTSIACQTPLSELSTSETLIYEGSAVTMTLSNEPQEFDGAITLPKEAVSASGLIITTESISQKFPEVSSPDATNVTASLHGHSYLFCLTNSVLSATETACQNDMAKSGDMLFDLNNDGTHSFLTMNEDRTMTETTTRPDEYSHANMINEDKLIVLKRIFIPFNTISNFSETSGMDIQANFYADHKTVFVDGKRWNGTTPSAQAIQTFDGIYQPTEDKTIYPINPMVEAIIK